MGTAARAEATVDVQVACSDPDIPAPAQIKTWVAAAIAAAEPAGHASVEVSVRVVDADEIRELNARYRQQDQATNVLSFPAGPQALPDGQPAVLGDVVVCAPIVRAEANAQGKSVASHWAHMLVHGTLHLLGYDHEANADAERMEGLECRILAAHGIADPYASP